jgi:hypothetical protein
MKLSLSRTVFMLLLLVEGAIAQTSSPTVFPTPATTRGSFPDSPAAGNATAPHAAANPAGTTAAPTHFPISTGSMSPTRTMSPTAVSPNVAASPSATPTLMGSKVASISLTRSPAFAFAPAPVMAPKKSGSAGRSMLRTVVAALVSFVL